MKKYKNKKWLYNEYVVNKKELREIGSELGCGHSTIVYWMKKFNIDRRSSGEAHAIKNKCNFSSYIQEFIIGELLGDGCLISNCSYSAYYQHGTKHKQYLEWMLNIFSKYGIEKVGVIRENTHKCYNYKCSTIYHMTTRTYPELKKLYDWFYIDNIKIIPSDIIFTPVIVRQWYIGDGSLVKRIGKKENPIVKISTNCFSLDEISMLVDRFSKLDIKCRIRSGGVKKGHTLVIPYRYLNKFFDYIGECPNDIKDIYQYKFDI